MLLGLHGKARSGKNTVSNLLTKPDCWGTRLTHAEEYAFADPLKELVCSLFNWNERHKDGDLKEVTVNCITPSYMNIYNDVKKTLPILSDEEVESITMGIHNLQNSNNGITTISPREAYQKIGTDVCRETRQSLWVDMCAASINQCGNTIITDVREENEAEFVRSKGGVMVHILRDIDTGVREHVSEQGIVVMPGDLVLDNNGTMSDLAAKVGKLAADAFGNSSSLYVFNTMEDLNGRIL